MRLAAALAAASVLMIVPAAGASGASWTIVSGVSGDNGWYRSAVKVQITSSGSGTCPTSATITFSSSSDTFQCTDSGQPLGPLQFNIDATAPSMTGETADRPPDKNGWYTHAVTVTFQGTDGGSGIASCTSVTYAGPDTGAGSATGTCRDKAGNVSSDAFGLKYDATPPVVTATPGRAPTKTGWYNHPVPITFSGTDATSGIDACTAPVRYAGPDTSGGGVNGGCTDQAGNQGSTTFALKYDSTPPRITDVATQVADDAVTVTWRREGGATATVLRAPGRGRAKVSIVYRGPALRYRDTSIKKGVVYHYTVATSDDAGNDARVRVAAALRLLMTPAPGTWLHAGATLKWLSSPGATYYNVQLFRNGRKVLTAWPVTATFKLPGSWTYKGRRETLTHGTYKWYVWPGRGARAAARYGRLLGGSSFRVR